MAGMTDYLENSLVNHVLRNTPYTGPGTVYVALLENDPGEAGDMGSELSGNGYARKPASFDAPSEGSTANTDDIVFDQATGDWNTVNYVAIMDSQAGGNALITGALTAAVTVNQNDSLRIDAGDLIISLM